MADEYHTDAIGNLNNKPSYVVGIPLSPSTTLYMDHPPDSRSIMAPSDFGPHKKKNTSFQITSVTVQGSRLNNDECGDDSADDLDESNADDLNTDMPSTSKVADFDAEQSDENSNAVCDDLPPCSGPIIIAKLPSNINEPTINVGLSIGVSPTFPTIGPNVVSSGVTMMTSNATTPVSAQIPIINPLPDHWQHRFKVVKIVSSEPFKRGRWLCMDFIDPPGVHQDVKSDSNDKGENHISVAAQGVPNAQSQDHANNNAVAHVYEIPVQQSYPGSISLTVGSQQPTQPLYGIILPVNNQAPQVTMVQNVGIQTSHKDSANNVPTHHSVQNTSMPQNTQPVQVSSESSFSISSQQNHVTITDSSQATISTIPNSSMQTQNTQMSFVHAPTNGVVSERANPALQCANNCETNFSTNNQVPVSSNSDESLLDKTNVASQHVDASIDKSSGRVNAETEEQESFSCLVTELSRTSGLMHSSTEGNTLYCRLPSEATAKCISSPTGAEKTSPPDVGRDLDPTCGSAASTGTSTVAIDNKIEQAMDLVKSHLMFAVREEVEVLKEKITELLERISQLEQENDILRANASPETLNQLNQSQNKVQGNSAHSPQGALSHPMPQQSSS